MKIVTHSSDGKVLINYIYTHKHLTGIISKRGKRWKLDIKSTEVTIENTAKIWSTKGKAAARMEKIFKKY